MSYQTVEYSGCPDVSCFVIGQERHLAWDVFNDVIMHTLECPSSQSEMSIQQWRGKRCVICKFFLCCNSSASGSSQRIGKSAEIRLRPHHLECTTGRHCHRIRHLTTGEKDIYTERYIYNMH